ncbi:aminotransferase class I/II-fold pyridoxal phosphate-dependent enzyme [Desulfonatronum sp. SC1]|uniref:aminotransferase class I/II-fold pyridoxal phosphate-dependent enzyme n=1 Tax=Desulfonatronum sp. SC1 TaxID=2109626 RepID=UPI00268BC9FE|nr:aminotransferase class I/II-fold pyridoxal phosphate-dependent enzyme [Desulfonatronum sp. SC1]
MNNNENSLGPPLAARRVIERFEAGRAPIYPSGDCSDLRQTLAAKFDKSADQFLVGNGACEVIASVIKAFCERGDNIVTADKTFAVYEWVGNCSKSTGNSTGQPRCMMRLLFFSDDKETKW